MLRLKKNTRIQMVYLYRYLFLTLQHCRDYDTNASNDSI